jgi:hypothetical protein
MMNFIARIGPNKGKRRRRRRKKEARHPEKNKQTNFLKLFFYLFTSFPGSTGSEWPRNKNKFSTIVIQTRTR